MSETVKAGRLRKRLYQIESGKQVLKPQWRLLYNFTRFTLLYGIILDVVLAATVHFPLGVLEVVGLGAGFWFVKYEGEDLIRVWRAALR